MYAPSIVPDEREGLVDISFVKKKLNQSLEIRIESESLDSLCGIGGLCCPGPLYDSRDRLADIGDDDRHYSTSDDRSDDDHDEIDSEDRQARVYTSSLHEIDERSDEYSDKC